MKRINQKHWAANANAKHSTNKVAKTENKTHKGKKSKFSI